MAEIITPILNIVSVLCSCTRNNGCCYLLGLQENKDALHTAMEELKATRDGVKIRVDEAENNPDQKRTPEVDNWLQRTEEIEGEVGEIFQKVDQEIERRCFGRKFPKNCWSARKIGKLVIKELGIVEGHKSKGDSFVGNDVAVTHKVLPPLAQSEPMNTTVGMESMLDQVWRLLVQDKVRIMGLYGCGGVGKTTLLKQINNAFLKPTPDTTSSSSNNTHGFDVVILVVVSQVIDIDMIQKKIGDRLGLSSPNKENIFNALEKKRFLLLLDDIWERVDLESIGVPPPDPNENNKSKVVFTTRSETVCGLMEANEMFKVECLPWNEAWSLFERKVGERALNSHPKVPELAEIVARECGGLPLALITIGRAMAAKKTLQEWKHAITKLRKSASEFPGMGDQVLHRLKLSYDYLGDNFNLEGDAMMIKSCFLYCALFPEDSSIYIPELIDYWIGEELISLNEFDHIDEARNKGYDVIGILKGACLLESDGQPEETRVKMHDTIRELALWIAHECGRSKRDKICIIEKFSDLTTPERSSWYNNAKRIYLIPPPDPDDGETEEVRSSPPPPLKSPNLITLIQHRSVVPQNFFEFTPLLRVLDLSGTNMRTFPTSITELVELRYLSLSCTKIKELPEELGKLVKLNLLDLSFMSNLMSIPPGVIGSLVELRVLNLHGFDKAVDWDLDEVYKLKHLNDLGITLNTEHNLNKLLSNQNLQMCTTHLQLKGIPEANIMVMGIEQLRQQQQQHLGSSSSSSSCCFQNLIQIQIWNCNGLKDLTWVGYLPNLKTLDVKECEELKILIVIDDLGGSQEGGGNEIIIFESLKTLILRYLPKLKSICRNALAFLCLKTILVLKCPQLKKLPFDSGSNTLQEIYGEEEWWNELRWEEKDNNNELLKSKFLPYFVEYSVRDDNNNNNNNNNNNELVSLVTDHVCIE